MDDLLTALHAEHETLRATLERCAQSAPAELKAALLTLKQQLEAHLPRKDQLYRAIVEGAKARNDPGTASIAAIFENNMRVQTAGVRGFFEQFEALSRQPEQLERRCKTLLEVVRTRLDTEERAVFPLYTRVSAPKENRT